MLAGILPERRGLNAQRWLATGANAPGRRFSGSALRNGPARGRGRGAFARRVGRRGLHAQRLGRGGRHFGLRHQRPDSRVHGEPGRYRQRHGPKAPLSAWHLASRSALPVAAAFSRSPAAVLVVAAGGGLAAVAGPRHNQIVSGINAASTAPQKRSTIPLKLFTDDAFIPSSARSVGSFPAVPFGARPRPVPFQFSRAGPRARYEPDSKPPTDHLHCTVLKHGTALFRTTRQATRLAPAPSGVVPDGFNIRRALFADVRPRPPSGAGG